MRNKKPSRPPEPIRPTAWTLAWWHVALGAAAALTLSYAVYSPALNGPFVFDDQYLSFFSRHYAEQTVWLATKGVRPFLMFTFWLNNQMAGVEPYAYHLWNLLFHVVNSLLVFLIARKIVESPGTCGPRRG